MKLMFQKVEELLVVVDESDVDTKGEQYCNEDVEQNQEVIHLRIHELLKC